MQHGIKFSGLELLGKSWYKFRQLNASVLSNAYTGRVRAGRARSRSPQAYRPSGGTWGLQIKADRPLQWSSVRSHLGYLKDQAVTVHNVLLFSRGPSRPNISPELQAELVAIRAMSSGTYKPEVQYFGDWSLVDHHGTVPKRGAPLWAGRRTPIIPAAHGLADRAALAASKNGGKR